MIMTIYDLSGIQSYIFATNRLREMTGASFIVHEAFFKNIPEILKEEPNDWEERAKTNKKFEFDVKDTAKIIYIGGGNALVIYKNEETEKDYTRKLQKKIFNDAGGALKLCSASIEIDNGKTLADNQKLLMDRLDENKRKTPNASTAKGFSINAHDNTNFEPVLLFGKDYATKSEYLKNEMYKNSGGLNIFKELKVNDIKFTDNFDLFNEKDKKNYLAVIHIDGNTVGINIRDFVKAQDSDILTALGKLSKLSYDINEMYTNTLSETITEIYNEKYFKDNKIIKKTVPFRPIIVDGDDVTVICAAKDALNFVKVFMQKLGEKTLGSLDEFKPTAAAGISYVNVGFPFYTAYDIAEQCCKNAKKATIKRGYAGGNSKSSVDYHICYGGVTGNVSEFREKNYIYSKKDDSKSVKHILNIRPYTFVDGEIYSYSGECGFEKTQDKIVDKIARSKLKGLRNEYGKSVLAAETYGDFLLARAEGENEQTKKTAKLLSKPFHDGIYNSENSTTEYYAKFFDVLDVLDFIDPIESAEEKAENEWESGVTINE